MAAKLEKIFKDLWFVNHNEETVKILKKSLGGVL